MADLELQALEFFERILVLGTHDVILHQWGSPLHDCRGSEAAVMTFALDATPLTVPTGGVARYTGELARALAETFPEDRYWLFSDQPFTAPTPRPANLFDGDGPRTAAERRWWLWGLPKALARQGVDLFHGTDFSVPYRRSRPSVMTLHDLSPWMDPAWQPSASRVRRRTPRLLRLGLADMVITPSDAVRRGVIERFSLSPDRVVAVPLAAGAHFRPGPVPKAAARPAGVPYFLFVGTLEPRKNIARLIEAWREVRRSQAVDLVLAGRVRHDFEPPSPEPGLKVLGAVPEADLPELYSGALACVYPSLYEGFGLPVLEAMQCGAPVIASRDPAILEVAGDAAIAVDATQIREMAQAMAAMASEPARRSEWSDKGRKQAAGFSWTRTARLTREVYDAALRVHARVYARK